MATQAKLMIIERKTGAVAAAAPIDDQLRAIDDEGFKTAIGKALGSNINIGFAGAVGKTFDDVIRALTSGSMVQKAMTLINFAENFLTAPVVADTKLVMDRIKENLASIKDTDGDFQLDARLTAARAPKAKSYKVLAASPDFRKDFQKNSDENANVDVEKRQGGLDAQGKPRNPLLNRNKDVSSENTFLGGEMDSKTPQQPVELLTEPQLDFLSQQAEPKVDLTPFNAVMPDEARRQRKIQALKEAGIHLSKAPGLAASGGVFEPFSGGEPAKGTAGAVDAASIVPNGDEAVADGITVKDKQTGKNQTYIEGKAENIVDPLNTWIQKAYAHQMPLKAGISGTTARFVGTAQMLGGTRNGAVVAMLGHLQAIEAHSFWEIVEGAGLGMKPGKYTPFVPNPGGMTEAAAEFVKDRVQNIGPDDAAKKKTIILGEE
jgi:hypothetical protein